jgi:hypothetical protein
VAQPVRCLKVRFRSATAAPRPACCADATTTSHYCLCPINPCSSTGSAVDSATIRTRRSRPATRSPRPLVGLGVKPIPIGMTEGRRQCAGVVFRLAGRPYLDDAPSSPVRPGPAWRGALHQCRNVTASRPLPSRGAA